MGGIRKRFSKEFKAKVAFEALKGDKTMSQVSSAFGVHVSQIMKWKKDLADGMSGVFARKGETDQKSKEKLIEDLYKRIGEIEMENNWLKKKLPY